MEIIFLFGLAKQKWSASSKFKEDNWQKWITVDFNNAGLICTGSFIHKFLK